MGNLVRRLERLERELEPTGQGAIPQAVMNEAFTFLSDEELEAVGEAVMRPEFPETWDLTDLPRDFLSKEEVEALKRLAELIDKVLEQTQNTKRRYCWGV